MSTMVMNASDEGSNILSLVAEGMEVFDARGTRIGTVRDVYLGEASEKSLEEGVGPATPHPPRDNDDNLVRDVARALVGDDDMPQVLRSRLLLEGYMRIDAPLLKRD